MSVSWHIVTPELPPDCGGVGDYTAQVAETLAANGDRVTVYCPPPVRWCPGKGLDVVTLGDRFGPRALFELSARIERDRNSRLLVQYVPAVFGRRGTNVAFCRWLLSRHRAGHDVAVMFHEPYLYLRWRPDHIVTAFTQRAMAAILLDAANHLYLSTDTWRRYLARLRPGAVQDAVTLPIPSAIPCVDAMHAVNATRNASIGNEKFLVGHFGSYGGHIAPILGRALKDLLASDDRVAVLCTGAGSDRFVKHFAADHPALRNRVSAVGRASAHDISVQLQACDVLLQPYPDGVTTRRTSVMSFVGPRALRPGEIEIDGGSAVALEAVPGYADRILVRPGLTGVAQVYAPRDISRRSKFRYDRLYIRRRSFGLDVRLILLSFWISFRGT